MMLKIFALIATLATGLISTYANAAFVATDWKVSGDKRAMLDTETGVEWLNIFATAGMNMLEVKSSIATGTLQGWRLPTNAEVESMYSRFFSGFNMNVHQLSNVSNSTLKSRMVAFKALLGSSANPHSKAAYYDENNKLRSAGVYILGSTYHMYGLNTTDSPIAETSRTNPSGWFQGFFLVSDGGTTLSSINNPALNINNPNAPVNQVPDVPADVPVHAGFGLLGLALMAFGLRRRVKGV